MNDSTDTGPAGLALAAGMAGVTARGRAQEISATHDPTGRERRAARRRATAVRG